MKGVKEVKSVTFRVVAALATTVAMLSSEGRAQQSTATNTLTAEERAAGWRLLFDGKTIDHWRGYQQKAVPRGWQVIDGAITRVGGSTDLVSVEEYDSFDFRFDWMVESGGNSGVMYHVLETEESTYHTGPEYQVLDNARHSDGQSPFTSAGACHSLYAPPKDVSRPANNWNESRIVIDGPKVEHWLNGVKVAAYELWSAEWNAKVAASKFNEWKKFGLAKRGRIALQQHDSRVSYRNLKIKISGAPGL